METKEQHNMRIASNLERKIEKRLTETNEEQERHLNTEKKRKSAARVRNNIRNNIMQQTDVKRNHRSSTIQTRLNQAISINEIEQWQHQDICSLVTSIREKEHCQHNSNNAASIECEQHQWQDSYNSATAINVNEQSQPQKIPKQNG
ncbi:18214_t:CDS:2 [Acaulospora morrowiae]|uniref:18214_t:CDS:1 n=1 Tax=Acaulospora morrowiae TaxID=94023 RepID=A0A9N9EFX4_9GLOM|nr:18214_t:CDS:2 [Acaulospora morrowiae]